MVGFGGTTARRTLAVAPIHLFGSGKPYRPNLSSLSVAGEAVAGFCLEKQGYTPLVRPLGYGATLRA